MTDATRGLPARPLPGVELVPPPTNVGVSFAETDGLPMQGPQLPGAMPAPPLNVPVTEASPAEKGLLQRLFGN